MWNDDEPSKLDEKPSKHEREFQMTVGGKEWQHGQQQHEINSSLQVIILRSGQTHHAGKVHMPMHMKQHMPLRDLLTIGHPHIVHVPAGQPEGCRAPAEPLETQPEPKTYSQ